MLLLVFFCTTQERYNVVCLISVLFECFNIQLSKLYCFYVIPLKEMPLAVVKPKIYELAKTLDFHINTNIEKHHI